MTITIEFVVMMMAMSTVLLSVKVKEKLATSKWEQPLILTKD